MPYMTERAEKLLRHSDGRGYKSTFLDLAQSLHEFCTGASDCLTEDQAAEYAAVLRERLRTWVHSERDYDWAVKMLLWAAVREWGYRAECKGLEG